MCKYNNWELIHADGEIVFECDGCHREVKIGQKGYPTVNAIIVALKSMGWTSKKIRGEWKDFCCKECENKFWRRLRLKQKKRGSR